MRQSDAVQTLFARHEHYLHLRCAQNRKDASCDADHALESDVDAKTAFLGPEILAIPEDRLNAFFHQEPALAAYRFTLSGIRRDAPHLLSGPEQSLLDQFQPQIADWQYDLYQQIVAQIERDATRIATDRGLSIVFVNIWAAAGGYDMTNQVISDIESQHE